MTVKSLLRSTAVASGLVLAGSAGAADLNIYRGTSCVSYTQSTLPSQTPEIIKQTLWDNFQSTEAGMNDPHVQASSRQAFTWAMEARWACTAAIGYLNGGNIDGESVGKCDCFHQRFVSLK